MSLKSCLRPLAASAVLLTPAPASAQIAQANVAPDVLSRAHYRAVDYAPVSYYEVRRTAYDQGYREGVKRGEQDARRGDRFGYEDEREFRRADKGYHRRLGDRERYRQVFRDGFAAGYSDAFSRLSPYGRNIGRQGPYARQRPYGQQRGYGTWGGGRYGGNYYSPAFENGARDGYEKGQEDARKSRSFDPLRHSWYRSGNRHYEGRYGSREQYKDVYRRGFQQGYERGFQEARYRW